MILARASLRRPLYAGALLASLLGVPSARAAAGLAALRPGVTGRAPSPAPARHGRCNPAWCALTRPTEAEHAAIVAEADRLLTGYAADTTALGRQCHALGATMREHAGDVRMIDYMWRETDEDGQVMPVTGDAHPAGVAAEYGTVHIARGYDRLNPDRGLPAILQTARHEFAHLNGLRQRDGGVDLAARLADACGPHA